MNIDHSLGYVKLVHITPDAEKSIVSMARVSTNTENTDLNLIRYLIRHKHWSPFEMAHMTVEIGTTRAISAQIIRHRSFSFQEFSQRYSPVDTIHLVKARRQDRRNRQKSIDDIDDEIQKEWIRKQQELYEKVGEVYQWALQNGIARECARFVLPLATHTRLFMTGNIRSWIHYLLVRNHEDTQWEHRWLAQEIEFIFARYLPNIYQAMRESDV